MAVDRRRLRLGIEDQIRDRYQRVPFTVDPGSTSVEVVLDYDDTQGVVDLGCEGPVGWRGWSGGARRRFVITAEAATPGYLPGELEEGVWHVVLGLHKVPAAGLEVTLDIRLPAETAPEPDPDVRPVSRPETSRSRLPTPSGLMWLAGDFHAHTLHSDGTDTVGGLAARAVLAGLDFLAVTDHNTTSHHPCLPRTAAAHGITLIPGQELTTARGHANAFGDIGWVDFREPADTWVEEVASRGGVLSVNHPVEGDCAWQHSLRRLPHALELWHSSWFRAPDSTATWAFWRRWSADAVPLGGSDFHGPGRGGVLGSPTTWVAAEDRTPEGVLEAVRAGRTALTTRSGPEVPMLVRVEDEVVAVDAESSVLVDEEGRRRRVTSAHERVPASWGQGLFHLEDADRRLLAIC